MDSKYTYQNKENRDDHHKREFTVKSEPSECNKRLVDQIVFEEDVFQNTGLGLENASPLGNVDQIKQELDEDGKKESESGLNICQGFKDGLELKEEPADQEKNKDIEELYADHEVKDEMVVGPVVFLQSVPPQTNNNQESPKSNSQLHYHVLKTSKRTTLPLSKKHKKQPHICKICKNEYKHETGLVKHMASHVTMDRVLIKTRRQNNRKRNVTHHKKSRSVDDATVASQDSVTRNHDKSIQKYVCDICQKVFETKNGIITHMKNHNHKSRKGNYFCDICNKYFSRKDHLKRHKEMHSNKYFTCDICQKAFKQKQGLIRHMGIHKSKRSYYCCEICNKCYTQRSSLRVHKEIHSNKYFTCDICQKAFKQKRYLVKHMNFHRSSEKNICDICNKSFSFRWTLKRHYYELHSNKYFTCDICQKVFKQQRYLATHIITQHSCNSKIQT